MSRVLLYPALAILVAFVALGAQRFGDTAATTAEIHLAAALLADGDTAGARLALDRVRDPGLEVVVRGRAWADLLEGAEPTGALRSTRLVVAGDPYPDATLLRRLISAGRPEAVAELIASGDPEARAGLGLLERIALLESGDEATIQRAISSPIAGGAGSSLEREFLEVESLRTRGGERIVRDRRGRLLGAIDRGGAWLAGERGEGLGLEGWVVEAPANGGRGVRLSLDLELSRLAQSSLGNQRGTIVVVEVATGRVLAAVSDSRTVAREGANAFREQRLEPASIAKLITASAALRAGIDLDDEIQRQPCHGFVPVEDGRLYCPVVPGRLSGLQHAMAVSCNTSFARLGHRLGSAAIVDEYRRFGFASSPSSLSQARLRTAIDSRRRLAEVSIGLNHSELTPLHAALMAAVFGNGGFFFEPSFVTASDGFLGLSPRANPPAEPDRRVLDGAALEELQAAMVAVPLWGTAGGIAPRDFPIAMKTGTASEPGRGFHVNYIGVAPWPAPRYAFAVRITDRRTSRRVRRAAYAATESFLQSLADFHRRQTATPGSAS